MEKVIRGYKLRNLISSNPLFSVFIAEHSVLTGQTLRVTLFSKELRSDDAVKSAFNQAAFRLSFAEHSYIVKNTDLIEENGDFAILSENLILRPIYDIIHRLSQEETESFLEKIFESLIYLNERNIYHASLGPDSIFIDEDNNPKIANYGIAEIILNANEPEMREKVLEFLVFAAPELSKTKVTINGSAEVFSCGKLIEYIFKSVHNSEISNNLDLIIQKCLFTDPNKRYRNVKDLLTDFRNYRKPGFVLKNESSVGFISTARSYKFQTNAETVNPSNQRPKQEPHKVENKSGHEKPVLSFIDELEKQKQAQSNTPKSDYSQPHKTQFSNHGNTEKPPQSGFNSQSQNTNQSKSAFPGSQNPPANKMTTYDVVIFGLLSMFFSFILPFIGFVMAIIGFYRASANKKKVKSFGRVFTPSESSPQKIGVILCIIGLAVAIGKLLA